MHRTSASLRPMMPALGVGRSGDGQASIILIHLSMAKRNNNLPSVIRVHCNRCSHETVHDILAGQDGGLWKPDPCGLVERCVGDDMRLIVMCQGCGNKGFVHYRDHYENGLQVDIYPHQILRKVPRWYSLALVKLNSDVLALFGEIYAALHSNAYRLAAMGIRATFEHIFIEKVGDHGTFQNNLNAFQIQGYLSLIERNSVSQVLEVGHAAIHRSHSPSLQDILNMLDILEHLIQALYVNDQISGALTAIPPRRKK
jgi:hypothetical protein